jgi:exoribonuclease-2
LIDFASHPESSLEPNLRGLLQRLGVAAELGSVRRLLARSGLWQRHQLTALLSSPWSSGFDPALEAEAQALAASAQQPRAGDDQRQDLTHLRSVTIDDPDTRDLDDALALERCSDGRRWIWIHVADPDRLVPADSPLDREARRRASSLYLAQGTVPMFPSCLSEGSFSLQQGRRCPSWSLAVELDQTGAIREKRLLRSWIQPRYRLSYSDADELIDYAPPQDDDLAELHDLLTRRRHWRERQGALSLEQAEGRFRRCEDTACLDIVEPTPSRQMVAEAMILAGAAVAELGRDADLALPYRTQAAAPLPSAAELDAIPAGPARLAAIRKGLSRGVSSCQPSPHFSLGLQAYVQVTSPIRRYGDLVCQRQFASLLHGGDRLSGEALAALLNELEPALRQGVQISREDQRHWQQVWFAEHRQGHWQGLFLRWLRPGDGLALVRIDALAMELPVVVKDRCEPGDALQVQVAQSDPDADLLRLSGRR